MGIRKLVKQYSLGPLILMILVLAVILLIQFTNFGEAFLNIFAKVNASPHAVLYYAVAVTIVIIFGAIVLSALIFLGMMRRKGMTPELY